MNSDVGQTSFSVLSNNVGHFITKTVNLFLVWNRMKWIMGFWKLWFPSYVYYLLMFEVNELFQSNFSIFQILVFCSRRWRQRSWIHQRAHIFDTIQSMNRIVRYQTEPWRYLCWNEAYSLNLMHQLQQPRIIVSHVLFLVSRTLTISLRKDILRDCTLFTLITAHSRDVFLKLFISHGLLVLNSNKFD